METFLIQGNTLLAQAEPQHSEPQHAEPQHAEPGHAGATQAAHGGEAKTEGGHEASFWGTMIYVAIVAIIAIICMAAAKKGFSKRVFTNPLARGFEHLYYFIENLAVGIIGSHGRKYIPMVMTFWTMIFISNIIALAFPTSPTADLSFDLGIALIAVFYVQWEGIKAQGVIGHFKHFAGPAMGLGLIVVNLMLFVIEIVSEMMKNLSLSLRLFGNIDGGHKAAEGMNKLGEKLGGIDWLNIPFGAFLMPVKFLTCIVQALIFSLLFCVYLSLVTHHDHGDDHGHADHGAEPAPAH